MIRPLLLLSVLFSTFNAFAADEPCTVSLEASRVAAARAQLTSPGSPLQPSLQKLRRDADRLLKTPSASVLDKTKTADSGNKHDYFSLGPYWWPNPTKPDGLPYIRRDGHVNPESKTGTDSIAFARTCNAVRTLGLAYALTGHEPYAAKAAALTRAWFLDPATAMTPHLEYAQAVPGKNEVRGTGVLESRHLTALTDGLALLARSPSWPHSDQTALHDWLEKFYDWLIKSPNGLAEAAARNNHGSWYDVQAAHLALYLGRTNDARTIIQQALSKRIEHQIEPDGRQPLELARTKSLDYCIFNLEALAQLARLGRHVDIDLWTHTSADGRSMISALRFIAPYADPSKPWPKEDLKEADRSRITDLIRDYRRHHDDPTLPLSPAPAEFDF
ncbi:alginate lyase [Nibricoccus aquaticus]|uniref:Alginate lyase n=1 Tax=Nibricoccus aquaticus TaxID=2576891 RepID=A0A290Q465_9BACT|nr:alginate lyase family protein [Nibricoccus aquaticus]ATC63087.1 alginate lyase [Nibricoccus aquaticus]